MSVKRLLPRCPACGAGMTLSIPGAGGWACPSHGAPAATGLGASAAQASMESGTGATPGDLDLYGEGYPGARAVHLDGGVTLECGSLSCTDSPVYSFSVFALTDDPVSGGGALFVVDPASSYGPFAWMNVDQMFEVVGQSAAVAFAFVDMYSPPIAGGGYHHIMCTVRTEGPPTRSIFKVLAASADGQRLFGAAASGEHLWSSSDGGTTWAERTGSPVPSSPTTWYDLDCSADGRYLVGCWGDGSVHLSADYGATWSAVGSGDANGYFGRVSNDGQSIYVLNSSTTHIYRSTDGGGVWTDLGAAAISNAIAIAKGAPLNVFGSDSTNHIFTSDDGGDTWTDRHTFTAGGGSLANIVSSSDGSKVALSLINGHVWTSTNGGVDWVERSGPGMTGGNGVQKLLAMSGDGVNLSILAGQYGTDLWTSSDGGVGWVEPPAFPVTFGTGCIAMSDDGLTLLVSNAATNGGNPYPVISGDGGTSWRVLHVAPGKTVRMRVDGVDVEVTVAADAAQSFVNAFNGLPLTVGTDGYPEDGFVGRLCDLRLYVGVSLLGADGRISLDTERLFRTADGRPADAAAAEAAIGVPTVHLDGGPLDFPRNRGTGGAFVLTGVLTEAVGPG